ncbi:O-demethylpuromycin-O-methyltransferase [Galdieria sulphuraria]|nr:O-demethylpuromycin-O-methyltransferase [Galdieria sulphuraria]
METSSDMASPEEYFDNFAAILDLTYGHWKTAIVRAVTSLRLLDEMDKLSSDKDGSPVMAKEIASKCGTHPEFTYRVLRAASALLLVEEHDSPARSFTVTKRGSLLLERQEGSARGVVLFEGSVEHCRCWLHLEKCLQTGNKVVRDVFEEDNYFDAFSKADSKHKEFLKVFQQGMASIIPRNM